MLECSFLSTLLLVRLKLSGAPFKFLCKLLASPVNVREGLTWTNTLAYFDSLSVTNKNFFISSQKTFFLRFQKEYLVLARLSTKV
jgi:hypothetical protein